MTLRKTFIELAVVALGILQLGCGDASGGVKSAAPGADGGAEDAGGDGGISASPRGADNPPTLGDQIDRTGRPGITTALVGTFNPDKSARDSLKDDYNSNSDRGTWVADYQPVIAAALPVYDALDRSCGDQLAAEADPDTRYQTLAGLLADDLLVVNAASSACSTYLGVEAEALGLVPDGGCGGRTPLYDVIETTYSVLVDDATDLSDWDDGVSSDNVEHDPDNFPFLAPPQ